MQKYLIILSLAIILIFGIFLNQLPEHEIAVITNTGRYIVLTLFLVIFLAILAISIFFSMIWYEKWQTAKQQRFDAGRKIITTNDGQVYALEPDKKATYRALHANPSRYINGKREEPTPQELATYEAFIRRNRADPHKMRKEVIEMEAVKRSVLDIINESIHFAIVGPTNAGKTTLASHLIDNIGGVVFILDPHAQFNEWSPNGTILQQFEDIESTTEKVYKEMRHRYTSGITNSQPILLVIDEWKTVFRNCPGIAEHLEALSDEGRKVGIRIIFLSQSDLIQDIGFNSAVLANFTRIILTRTNTLKNEAEVKVGKSIEAVTLPGKYVSKVTVQKMLDDGLSKRQITQEVFGEGKYGSFYNERLGL